jgi:hypothetical protein
MEDMSENCQKYFIGFSWEEKSESTALKICSLYFHDGGLKMQTN